MADAITPIRLRDFNSRISLALRNQALINCWVVAEILDVGIRGGHCYMDLIDKDPTTNKLVARIKGIIWANRVPYIKHNFESATGQQFQSGLKVMLQVTVNYHELFGLSVIISDINPEYTLGDMERQRREIIARLTTEGIIDMNKQLPMPTVPQRIAVISAAGAAGYGDFVNQLHNNSSGIQYYTALFEARMQGAETVTTIINALNKISRNIDKFDVVVIIRGGGATSDLNSFDDYNLASHVAQFPLPVITGIGHERDNTVIDFVSHLRVKTPTAAAEWLIEQGDKMLERLNLLSQNVIAIAQQYVQESENQLRYYTSSIPVFAKGIVEKRKSQLREYAVAIPSYARSRIDTSKANLVSYRSALIQAYKQRIKMESMHLDRLEDNVKMLSPVNTLKRGYSITIANGKAVTSINNIKLDDEVTTMLADGKIISNVKSKYQQ